MPTEPKTVAVIPARWASSRFPGKPLAKIGSKPMIQWVADQARKARSVSRVLVATDDERIVRVVRGFGGEAVMTSSSHPSGTDRVAEAVENLECDIVVNVQGDEPLMPPDNIDLVVRALADSSDVPVSTLKMRIDNEDDLNNAHITKVVVDRRGRALYFSRAPIPHDREARLRTSGDLETLETARAPGYKHIGLYAYRKSFLREFAHLAPSPLETIEKLEQLRILENGIPLQVVETDKDSIGVDTREDLASVERIIQKLVPGP